MFISQCIERNSKTGLYEPLLQENEREAITELLQYLESKIMILYIIYKVGTYHL
jgi:hypothetical protein